jgi:DNA-binding GntR family transcriptional regulator
MRVAAEAVTSGRRPRSLAEQAYQLLMRMITRLELAPGSLIVEKELMAALGIGRTPIREALQRLAMEGLVVHMPNRGMFVADITTQSVQHIYEFRALIDGPLVRLAAERATPEQIEELGLLHERFLSAKAADDVDAYVELLRRFYTVLAAAAENIYLAEVIPRIFNLHLRLWFYISSKRGGWHDVAKAHTEMAGAVAAAIRDRDADRAEAAMETYIAGRHQDMRDLL